MELVNTNVNKYAMMVLVNYVIKLDILIVIVTKNNLKFYAIKFKIQF